jgi:hypothetical protein
MKQSWAIAGVLVGGLLWMSSGCSSATSLSEDFGESMATAVRSHRLPSEQRGAGFVLDGQPAQHIMRRYIRSFDRSSPAASSASSGLLTPSDSGSGGTLAGQ